MGSLLRHAGSLVAACGLLVVTCMRDLVPQPGMEPRPPALRARSLTHWTTREVLIITILSSIIFLSYHIFTSSHRRTLCICSVTFQSSLHVLFMRVGGGGKRQHWYVICVSTALVSHNYVCRGKVAYCTVRGFPPPEYSSLPQVSLKAHQVQPLCTKIIMFLSQSLCFIPCLRRYPLGCPTPFSWQPCPPPLCIDILIN